MWIEIGIGLVLLFLYLYHYITCQFDEFKKRGIPFAKPSFPFGSENSKQTLLGKVNFLMGDKLLYEEFKNEKLYGFFMMGQPTLIINDEDLAKNVMIKDFDHFTDLRSFGYEAETRDGMIIKYMFTNMKGETWKKLRGMMGGVFTSGKLKQMTPFMVTCAEQCEDYLKKFAMEGTELEARDTAAMFSMDAFASAGFGIELNSFKNPDSVFRKMILALVQAPGYGSSWDVLRLIFITAAPGIAKLLNVANFPRKPTNFLCDVIERTIKERQVSGTRRNDLIDVVGEEIKNSDISEQFTEAEKEKIITANLFLLFLAGFDTISITLSMVFHKLILFGEVQDKLRAEIDEKLENSDGKVTYDLIQELKYMDMVLQESMRYNALFNVTERACTKDYKVPGTDIIIPKGRLIHIWMQTMENSKKNFKNPDTFDPDNFLPENNPNKFAFMGFGQGPRGCPGTRFAYLVMKLFLVHVMRSYEIVQSEKTNMGDLKLDPKVIFAVEGGVWFKLKNRE